MEGCDRPRHGRLCWLHWKRDQRRRAGRSAPELEAPAQRRAGAIRERLREAALAYADAEEDGAHRLADERLVRAAEELAEARGWRPPRRARTLDNTPLSKTGRG